MPKLIDQSSGETILEHVEFANTFWKRFKGLQLRRSLPADTGMLITPCSSLHTCFMRFPIDVIMLNDDNVVVGIRTKVVPWRAVICNKGTVKVLEISASALTLSIGMKLQVESTD